MFSPTQFVLAPGQSQQVDFQVQVDNSLVPSASEYPCDYSGAVLLQKGEDVVRLPFSFLKGSILDIDFGTESFRDQPSLLVVHGLPKMLATYPSPGKHRKLVLPDGRYDILAWYSAAATPALVMREGVSPGLNEIQIRLADASHLVRLETVLPDGSILGEVSEGSVSLTCLRHIPTGFSMQIGAAPGSTSWLWSDVSPNYVFDFSLLVSPVERQPGYVLMHQIDDGINRSRVLKNTPADLKEITLRHGVADPGNELVLLRWLANAGLSIGYPGTPGSGPLQEKWRLMPEPAPDFQGGYLEESAFAGTVGTANLYSTPLLRRSQAALTMHSRTVNGIRPYWSTTSTDLACGIGPYSWVGRFSNEPGTVQVTRSVESVSWFPSQTGDSRREGPASFRVVAGGTEIRSGQLAGSVVVPVAPGNYRFETGSNFLTGDVRPVLIAADFDTRRSDPNPPYILNVQLLAHGVAVDAARPDGAEMGLLVGDDQGVASVTASMLAEAGWVELPGAFVGGGWYLVTFPPLQAGLYELRFRFVITDSAGNTLSYESSTPVAAPDLALQASHRGKLAAGEELEYVLSVTGMGRTAAGAPITVIDQLPTGISFVSAEGSGWSCQPQPGDPSRIRCLRNEPVPPGGTSSIVLRVRASQGALPASVNRATLICGDDTVVSNDSVVDVVGAREGGAWQALGPDGGPIHSLAVTRGPSPLVYAGSMGLVLKSTDRGDTWTSCTSPFNGSRVSLLVVRPDNHRVLYAATDFELFRSNDGGNSWRRITSSMISPYINDLVTDPVNPSILYMTGGSRVFKTTDAGDTWFSAGAALASSDVSSLAVAPSRPEIVYAGGANFISKSTDGGATWAKLADLGAMCIAVHPRESETVYIGGSASGVSRSTDGGRTWQSLSPGSGTVTSLAVNLRDDQSLRIVALASPSVSQSTDGGQSWVTLGSKADYQATAYAFAAGDDEVFVGSVRGVYRFAPDSGSWQFTSSGLLATRITTLARSEGSTFAGTENGGLMVWRDDGWRLIAGTENAGGVVVASVDPTDSRVIYVAGNLPGLLKTTDGGASWVTVTVMNGRVNSLAFHPTDSSILFAATDLGVFKSSDRGSSWVNLSSNLPTTPLGMNKIVVHPHNPSRLFLAGNNGVYRSTDGGGSWQLVTEGLPVYGVKDVVIDPKNSEIIYAAGYGVYKSGDGGDHWVRSDNGLTSSAWSVNSILIDPRSSSILYAGTSAGVYETTDQGTTWRPLNTALPGGSVSSIMLDPQAPARMWVATWSGLYFADLRPDVVLIKSHQGSLVAGRTSSYTLTIANTGEEATTGTVSVTDSLPSQLTFVSASALGWETTAGENSVTFSRSEPLAPHSSHDVVLQVVVSPESSGVCTNVASLSVDFDRDTSDNLALVSSIVVSGITYAYPFWTSGQDRFTGLAFANYGETETAVQLTAFGQDGSPSPFFRNPAVFAVPARSQLAALTSELFDVNSGAPQFGWVELWSSQPLGTMFQIGGPASLDGGSAVSEPAKTLYFTRLMDGSGLGGRSWRTTVSLINPGLQPVTVELRQIKNAKPVANAATVSIPARGCVYASPQEWFGDPVPEADYLRADVVEEAGLVGFEMVDADDPEATICLPAVAGDSAVGPAEFLYSAQLAASDGYYTELKLVNTATTSRKVTLRATDDIGQPLADPVVVDLSAGGSVGRDAGALFQWKSAQRVGSLRVEANGPGVIGDVLFGDVGGGFMAAALPLQTRLLTEAVFGQVANGLGFFTGLAVLNPGQVDADVTIQVFSNDGKQTGETVRRLASGVRLVGLLTELLPETAGQIGGYVRLVSTQPVVAQQLFGNGDILSAVVPTIVR